MKLQGKDSKCMMMMLSIILLITILELAAKAF